MNKINIPITVPKTKETEYKKNYKTATRNTGSLMLFPGDQKVEHLNRDFWGEDIPEEVADPEHFFKISAKGHIGVFASQIGLVASYARDYPKVPYLIKLNAKTNLVTSEIDDPFSNAWIGIDEVLKLKKQSGTNIVGVGYTLYIGSRYEAEMLKQVSQLIFEAHQAGLIFVLWLYPRGEGVPEEKTPEILAGAAGVAACLGADFVKLNYPYSGNHEKDAEDFRQAVVAAGRTKVICVGGSKKDTKDFLYSLHCQKHIAGTRGNAIARNIYQRPLDEAIRMTEAISAINLYDYSVEDAYEIFLGNKKLKVKKTTKSIQNTKKGRKK